MFFSETFPFLTGLPFGVAESLKNGINILFVGLRPAEVHGPFGV
jgi:hypothetical protein